MDLKNYLRGQGYDLIDGPIRNHNPLQLWLKKTIDEVDFYYSHVNHAFVSTSPLNEITNAALSVNSTKKNEYGFNIGITLLEDILKALGLGSFELSAKLKSGKKVSISYDNSLTREYPTGEVENYIASADFMHNNPPLLKNANRDNILILTGIVFAKNLVVDIETEFTLTAELVASLNAAAEGKLDFSMSSTLKLKMVSSGSGYFPIAVKAHRIDFDKGKFKKLTLVTDTRNFF